MSIFFFDSMAHYNSAPQMESKWANSDSAPVASAGAFGYYGTRPASSVTGGPGAIADLMVNFPNATTIEISAYFIASPTFTTPAWFILRNGTGPQTAFYLFADGHIQVTDGVAASLGVSAAAAVPFGAHRHLYVKAVSNAAGSVQIKIDGVEVLNLVGVNTNPQAAAGYTQLSLFGLGSTNVADCIWSHVALANAAGDITGRPRVQAVFPDGAGNYSQWNLQGAASYHGCVGEQFPDEDATYAHESTVNDRSSATYSNFLSSTDTILAVAVVPRARTDDGAARTMKTFVRASATDYDHPDTVSVPGSYAYLQQIYETNPDTGLAWTPAEVNAIEAGIKVVS